MYVGLITNVEALRQLCFFVGNEFFFYFLDLLGIHSKKCTPGCSFFIFIPLSLVRDVRPLVDIISWEKSSENSKYSAGSRKIRSGFGNLSGESKYL